MSQVYRHTLLSAAAANTEGVAATNQDNFNRRSIYISGPFTATVRIEVSPDAEGATWFLATSQTAPGVYPADVICRRIRAVTTGYVDGAVTVVMVAYSSH